MPRVGYFGAYHQKINEGKDCALSSFQSRPTVITYMTKYMLKGTFSSNMIDVNMARHKTSYIKHTYVHLSCLAIGSACTLGTVYSKRSCPYFTA